MKNSLRKIFKEGDSAMKGMQVSIIDKWIDACSMMLI